MDLNTENANEKNRYKISFNYKYGKICVYKRVLQGLGNPTFIQFLIKPEDKLLFIVGSEYREHDSLLVRQYAYSPTSGMIMNGQRFIKKISEIARWTLEGSYVVEGKYIDEMNMIEFNLTNAIKNTTTKDK